MFVDPRLADPRMDAMYSRGIIVSDDAAVSSSVA